MEKSRTVMTVVTASSKTSRAFSYSPLCIQYRASPTQRTPLWSGNFDMPLCMIFSTSIPLSSLVSISFAWSIRRSIISVQNWNGPFASLLLKRGLLRISMYFLTASVYLRMSFSSSMKSSASSGWIWMYRRHIRTAVSPDADDANGLYSAQMRLCWVSGSARSARSNVRRVVVTSGCCIRKLRYISHIRGILFSSTRARSNRALTLT
jgi:hypothetical protein